MQTAVNNIDNTNIGAAGLYASNLIPTNASQATFGGTPGVQYTFNGSDLIVVSSRLVSTTVGSTFSVPGFVSNGCIIAQNGASSGAYVAGGATDSGQLTYSTGAWAFAGTSANSLQTTMKASQTTPGVLVNGAASISGNLLQVDLLSGGTHALTVSAAGALVLNSNPNPSSLGDMGIGRSAALAFLFMGTSGTTGGQFDFGGRNAGGYSFSSNPGSPTYAQLFGSTYNNVSDASLKTNVARLSGSLAIINQLKPSSFTWKVDSRNDTGFVAQEVAAILPGAVTLDNGGLMGYAPVAILAHVVQGLIELEAAFVAYRSTHP